MAFSREYKEKVMMQLSKVGPVSAKDMFGGVGIYFEGHFFAVIIGDTLYFKTDENTIEDYKKAGMRYWEISKSYFELPKHIFNNIEELKVWVDKAVSVAIRKKKTKSKFK